MPMKNAETWVSATLDSIIAQSFECWELIIVNDHSDDDSVGIVDNFEDERIKLFQSQGSGIIDALKLALSKSEGTYVTRMDSDDIMPDNKIENLYEIASKSDKIVATGLVKYFGDQPISPGYLAYEMWLNQRCVETDHWQWIYRECVIASANWMTCKNNIDFSSTVYPEDYDLVFDWYKKGLIVESIDEVTHLWREHPQRTSRNSKRYQQKSFFDLKINRFIDLKLKSDQPVFLLGSNQKQKLVADILAQNSINFISVSKENLTTLINENTEQVLICVYPNEEQKREIETFLEKKSLHLGEHYWYV